MRRNRLGTAAVILGVGIVVFGLSILIGRLDQKGEIRKLWAELTSLSREVDQLNSERNLTEGWQAENQRLSAEIQVLEEQLAGLEKRMDSKVSEIQLIYALQQEVEMLKARAVQTGPEVVTPKEEPAGAEGGPKQVAVGRQEKAPAVPTLKTLAITTDSSWRVLDAEMEGWTDASFNDGNWPRAKELLPVSMGDFQAKAIWFPESPYPFHVFFRRKFEVEGTRVISGRMIVKVYANEIVVRSPGNLVHLYVNGTFVGSVKETYSGDREFDISPLVRPGGNLIAVEAEFMGRPDSGHWWALVLVVRSE